MSTQLPSSAPEAGATHARPATSRLLAGPALLGRGRARRLRPRRPRRRDPDPARPPAPSASRRPRSPPPRRSAWSASGIGAVTIGPLTDRFGRRKTLITSVAAFSVLHHRHRARPDVTQFTALRFLAGLGLGACLPTALAFMSEHAKTGRGGSAVTRMMTGYHVGAVLTALLAL